MKILAVDTATQRCSAALMIEDHIEERCQTAVRAHAELILPMVEALLSTAGVSLAQLDALAFGRGPGGFTGVRVAAAMIQGLAFGVDLPVVPVSDLMALAVGAHRLHNSSRILSCLDARMGEVYYCTYKVSAEGSTSAGGEELLVTPERMHLPDAGPWFAAGPGLRVHGKTLMERLGSAMAGQDDTLLPAARDIAALARQALARGQAVDAEAAVPVYLRERVAWPKSPL